MVSDNHRPWIPATSGELLVRCFSKGLREKKKITGRVRKGKIGKRLSSRSLTHRTEHTTVNILRSSFFQTNRFTAIVLLLIKAVAGLHYHMISGCSLSRCN